MRKLTLSHIMKVGIIALLLAAVSHAVGASADATVSPQARPYILTMPQPTYPDEARGQRLSGHGICELFIDIPTRAVTRVRVVQSTGSRVLDLAAVKAFRAWRARPGKLRQIRIPFTFTYAG